MWKRLNPPKSSGGARQSAISEPVLVETTIFEKSYGAAGGINVNMDVKRSGAPPPRPRRDDIPNALPILPFGLVPATHSRENLNTNRPASSVYSQPSPNAYNDTFPYNTYAKPMTPNSAGVSPPSSPEMDGYQHTQSRYQDHEVSPIDEIPNISRLGFGKSEERPDSRLKLPSSNIPVMRREKRRNQVAAANSKTRKDGDRLDGRKTADVKWDPYSGEQTTSEKGKPQSVKPGEFVAPALRPVSKMGNTSTISAGPVGSARPQMSFGERVRKLKNNVLVEKPEWKGATGRATIVPTPTDNYDIPPLRIPPRSDKRPASRAITPVSSIRSGPSETNLSSSYLDLPGTLSINAGQSLSGRNSPQTFLGSSHFAESEPVHAADDYKNLNLKTTQSQNHHAKKESVGSIERNFREALKNSFSPVDSQEPYTQPPSRFSVSTKATSEANQSTRAPSVDLAYSENMPPMPMQMHTMTTQGPSSILNRKRPKVSPESPINSINAKSLTRKAVNSSSPITISMTSSMAPPPRTSSMKTSPSNTKSLPSTPAEAQSHDLISTLEARLEGLAHRRQNITRSIRAMTELMPADRMLVTEDVRRKRELEKQKIKDLSEEEAEIKKEEHELGLKLHRAWKRKDKLDVYEPTGLWVRRVTN